VAENNQNSIHISYIGGIDSKGKALDNRTPRQIISMLQLIIQLRGQYPQAEIPGHRDFPDVKKGCPGFDVREGCGGWEVGGRLVYANRR